MQLKHLLLIGAAIVIALAAWLIPRAIKSDVKRIQEMIVDLTTAANNRNVRGILTHLHDDYTGPWAKDKQTVGSYAFLSIQRYQSIQVQYGDVVIELAPDKKSATVVMWAVVWASTHTEAPLKVISRWKKTDQIKLFLQKDGWSWLIRRAEVVRQPLDQEP